MNDSRFDIFTALEMQPGLLFLPHDLVLSSLFFSKVKIVWNTKSGYIIVRLMKASTKLGLNNFQHKWLEVDAEKVLSFSIKLNFLLGYDSDF